MPLGLKRRAAFLLRKRKFAGFRIDETTVFRYNEDGM